jgi:transposase
MFLLSADDLRMVTERLRVWRTAAEKRRIVELTLQSGMSVARVAQAEGVNSHQVFQWRRAYRQGTLVDAATDSGSMLPVVVRASDQQNRECGEAEEPSGASGAIHIELPGCAAITVESGADVKLLRAILESLRP